MSTLNSTLPKLLGICFYYPPATAITDEVFPVIHEFTEIFPWQNPENIQTLLDSINVEKFSDLSYDFSILFEGQGIMPAPPWGSVYREVDQLLMGETTIAYRHFLHQYQLQLATTQEEPEDQFGLMLMAISILLERNEITAVQTLLADHLSPWAFLYLDKVKAADLEYNFYPVLAEVAKHYLIELSTSAQLAVA